jgi:hypothetical protein
MQNAALLPASTGLRIRPVKTCLNFKTAQFSDKNLPNGTGRKRFHDPSLRNFTERLNHEALVILKMSAVFGRKNNEYEVRT